MRKGDNRLILVTIKCMRHQTNAILRSESNLKIVVTKHLNEKNRDNRLVSSFTMKFMGRSTPAIKKKDSRLVSFCHTTYIETMAVRNGVTVPNSSVTMKYIEIKVVRKGKSRLISPCQNKVHRNYGSEEENVFLFHFPKILCMPRSNRTARKRDSCLLSFCHEEVYRNHGNERRR